jgi:hypothetical protein
MYKVKLAVADTIVIEGVRPDPSAMPISLVKGWNWIGFISQKNIALNEALAGLNATPGDIIKSQFKFAVYDQNNGWVGNLTFMKPGEGYMYKADQPASFVYPKPSVSNAKSVVTSLSDVWEVQAEEYRDNMSLIAHVKIPNGQAADNTHILGAFVNGVCRGTASPEFNPVSNEYNYFITIFSNDADEKIEFKWYSRQDGLIYKVKESVSFTNNQLKGYLADPVILNLDGAENYNVSIYPNPVGQEASVAMLLKEDVQIYIEVSDIYGQQSEILLNGMCKAGAMNIKWNTGRVIPGIYLVKVTIGSETQIFKVIKY